MDFHEFRAKAIFEYCQTCYTQHPKEQCVFKHSIDFGQKKSCKHIVTKEAHEKLVAKRLLQASKQVQRSVKPVQRRTPSPVERGGTVL